MPKVKARILAQKIVDGKLLAKVQFDGKCPRDGEIFSAKWGSVRTLPQNSLYWVYLNWLIDTAGLKDQGHFFADTLHENLKKHLLSGPKGETEIEATTTDLTKL